MNKKKFNIKKAMKISIPILIVIISLAVGFYFFNVGEQGDFEIDRLFIRNVLEEGSSTETSISISNNGLSSKEFSIKINEIEDLIIIEEKKFNINAGDEKSVKIEIGMSENTKPGIYLGNIEINNGETTKKIPITIEVQTKEVLFSSSNPPPEISSVSGSIVSYKISLGTSKKVMLSISPL